MSEIKDGGPAFPGVEKTEYPSCSVETPYPGMTLRDYFAAKAMAAFIGNNKTGLIDMPRMAEGAYKMADFMLRAREA